jgi:DNA-binding transcriptional LysR family regulator
MFEGISLERLGSFLKVADAGSFVRAAEGDPVRQSQFNRQVSELEKALGAPLTARRGRGIELTAAGERLAIAVRELVTCFDDMEKGEDEAPLRFTLGAGDSLLQWWVVPRLGELGTRVPRAIPRLTALSSEEIVAQLLDGRLDFGLVRAGAAPRGLVAKPLGEVEYALFVPKRLIPRGVPADAAALVAAVPLALQQSEPELNERLLGLAGRGKKIEAALECETFPQAYRAMRSGSYAAVLPAIIDTRISQREVVEVKLPGLARFAMRLQLAWHPRTIRRGARYEALAEALADLLALRDE